MAKRWRRRPDRGPSPAGPSGDEPPLMLLAVSRPEDLEPLGRPARRLRAAVVIDGVTAAAYAVAALGFDPLGLGGALHLATLFVTELLLRLFSEPFDLILAQDRRVVSPWMQCELVLALGGILGLFVVMVAAFFRSGVPIVTYGWRILNRVVDVWTRPVGSREHAQNAARMNRPLGAAIFPIVGLGLALHQTTGLGPEVTGAIYFALAAFMDWTGWRPDVLSRKARATPGPDAG